MFRNIVGSGVLNTKAKHFENRLIDLYLVIEEKPFRCIEEDFFCKFPDVFPK